MSTPTAASQGLPAATPLLPDDEVAGRWFPCLACDGRGAWVVRDSDGTKRAVLCPKCDGEGHRFATEDLIEGAEQIGSDNPFCEHDWSYTGTVYGGDDESYHGEGRVYCSICGADGDA